MIFTKFVKSRSALQRPVLHLDVSTPQLHLDLPRLVWTTWACAAHGSSKHRGLGCTWPRLDNKRLCCSLTWLHYRGLSCTWTCLDNMSLCCSWTFYTTGAWAAPGRVYITEAYAAPWHVYTRRAWAAPELVWTTWAWAASGCFTPQGPDVNISTLQS